jgi:hypothetical protein
LTIAIVAVGGVDIGIVPVRTLDAGLQSVDDNGLRDASEVASHFLVRIDESRQLLIAHEFAKGVQSKLRNSAENRFLSLAHLGIHEHYTVAVVHLRLLTSGVHESQRDGRSRGRATV